MSLEPMQAVLWHKCGAADIRPLLGRDTGHQVIAWGQPSLWHDVMGIDVKPHKDRGTSVPIAAEPGRPDGFSLSLYRTAGVRNEVRLRVPPLITTECSAIKQARANEAAIDPDAPRTDNSPIAALVVFLIKMSDGTFHFRASLYSTLPGLLRTWIDHDRSGGHKNLGQIMLDAQEQRIWETLLESHTVLLYGPPGTGKTHLMLKLRRAFEEHPAELAFDWQDIQNSIKATRTSNALPSKRSWAFTTFHQSLTYESFVVGLRPIVETKGTSPGASTSASVGALRFETKNGIFLKLAAHAMQDESCSLLLIDELNRGNVADILGELITILELDKRLGPDGKPRTNTVTVTLPIEPENGQPKQEFQMPYHFYLLASMNSLDRSVAPIDSALRRRFRLINLRPDLELAQRMLLGNDDPDYGISDFNNVSDIQAKSLALRILSRINSSISSFWGPEFAMGHSYILSVKDATTLISVCNETILPQLFELYRDHPDGLRELLGTDEPYRLAIWPPETDTLDYGTSTSAPPELVNLQDPSMDHVQALMRLYWLGHGKLPTTKVSLQEDAAQNA